MKTFRSNIPILVATALLFISCSNGNKDENGNREKDALSVTPAELEFAADDAEKKTVAITTNVKNWTVTQSVDWLIIVRETDRITVTVEKNRVTSARSGTITVKAGEAEPAAVSVTQHAGEEEKPALSVTQTELEFGDNDPAVQSVFVVTTAGNWEIMPSAGWFITEKASDRFTVMVRRNMAVEARTGTITVTAEGTEPVTVAVTQRGYAPPVWASEPGLQTLKAFPGAEGFGAATTGGRGGRALYVTRLADDSSEGSLRWAVNQSGARTIMFKVSGNIVLNSRLSIRNGNLTIAGHTAPGDGVCVSGYDVIIDAGNVIIRYMRFRMGDLNDVESDAIWGRYQKNVILDHCSMSWSVDECASFYENEDFTMQWCILSESLRASKHEKGNHGYGGIWGGKRASFHHNLLAHHDSRNPRFAAYSANRAEGLVDFRNNVIYNWGGNSGYGGEGGNYNMVNNYYQPSPTSGNKTRIVNVDDDASTGIHGVFYVAGNVMMNDNGTVNTTITNDNWRGVTYNSRITNTANARSGTEFEKGEITTHTAQEAYQLVLAGAGASFRRDAIDTRVINEVRNRLTPIRASGGSDTRAGLIDSQTDVGGWCSLETLPAPTDTDGDGIPDEWETANGLNPNDPADGTTTTLSGTYTNLEVYLYDLLKTN